MHYKKYPITISLLWCAFISWFPSFGNQLLFPKDHCCENRLISTIFPTSLAQRQHETLAVALGVEPNWMFRQQALNPTSQEGIKPIASHHSWLNIGTGRTPKQGCNKSGSRPSTFLWKISTRPSSYLFGTLHVAYTRIWPEVHWTVKEVFRKVDSVYFELNLLNSTTLAELANCQLLPPGVLLSDLLPRHLYSRLEKHLFETRERLRLRMQSEQKHYSNYLYTVITQDWKLKRPMWVLLLLHSLAKVESSEGGVPVLDLFLAQEAQRYGKECGSVEDVSDQCDPLNQVDNSQASLAIALTLDNLSLQEELFDIRQDQYEQHSSVQSNSISLNANQTHTNPQKITAQNVGLSNRQHWTHNPVQRLIEKYQCGDLSNLLTKDGVMQVINKPDSDTRLRMVTYERQASGQLLPQEFVGVKKRSLRLIRLERYLTEELILRRNGKMAHRIMHLLRLAQAKGKSTLFAIGVAHFIGARDTLLHHLQQHGYQITAVPPHGDQIQKSHENTDSTVRISPQDHFARTKAKGDVFAELFSEYDVPEFRPRYVNFGNSWIKIEDFNPTNQLKYDSKARRPSQGMQTQNKLSNNSSTLSVNYAFKETDPSSNSACRIVHKVYEVVGGIWISLISSMILRLSLH